MSCIVFAMRPGERGHINASLYLAKQLKARGHKVWYAADDGDADYLKQEGFPCVSLPMRPPDFLDSSPKRSWISTGRDWLEARRKDARSLDLLRVLLKQSKDSISGLAPDLIVIDEGVWWLPTVAAARNLRAVYLATTLPRPVGRGAFPPIHEILARPLFYAAALVRGISPLQLTLNRRVSKGAFRNVWDCWDYRLAIPTLVACPEALDIPGKHRAGHLYIEPCIDRDRVIQNQDVRFPAGDKAKILVSLGSAAQPGLDRVFDVVRQVAIRNPQWSFLASGSGSGREGLAMAEPLPSNLRIERHVPQLALMAEANLLVSHCGLNSVKEAVLASVPILGLPIRRDQPAVAARISYHQLGLVRDFQTVSPTELERMISQILDETRYKENVRRLAAKFLETEAENPGLKFIERLIAGEDRVEEPAL